MTCGSVGRAFARYAKGPRFESQQVSWSLFRSVISHSSLSFFLSKNSSSSSSSSSTSSLLFTAGSDTLIPLGCWNLPSLTSPSPSVTSEHVQTDQDPYKCLSKCNDFFGFGAKKGGTCFCLSEYTSAGRSNKCNAPCPNGYVDSFGNSIPRPGYLCGSTNLTVINVYRKRPG